MPATVVSDTAGGLDGLSGLWTPLPLPDRDALRGVDQAALLPPGAGGDVTSAADATGLPSDVLLRALSEAARQVAAHVDPALTSGGLGAPFEPAASQLLAVDFDVDAPQASPLPSAAADAGGPPFGAGGSAAWAAEDVADDVRPTLAAAAAAAPPPPAVGEAGAPALGAWSAAAYPIAWVPPPSLAVSGAAVVAAGAGAAGADPAGLLATADPNVTPVAGPVEAKWVPEVVPPPAHPSAPPRPAPPSSPPRAAAAEPPEAADRRKAAARAASEKSRRRRRDSLAVLTRHFEALPAHRRSEANKVIDAAVADAGTNAEAVWDAAAPLPPNSRCRHVWLAATRGAELARLRAAKKRVTAELDAARRPAWSRDPTWGGGGGRCRQRQWHCRQCRRWKCRQR